MKYDLSKLIESKQAREYFDKLLSQGSIVDITKKYPNRSLNQNSYLHLLLSYCSLEYGETLDFFKEYIWKRHINKDIFLTKYTNPKTGEERDDWRSSADITTHEMTIAVDRLIAFASKEMGLDLPHANQFEKLRHMENQVEINKKYL